MSTLVNLSGSLKDIGCGTLIKIPMDAGYVSYSKSSENSEMITMWMKQQILPNKDDYEEYLDNYNRDDEA